MDRTDARRGRWQWLLACLLALSLAAAACGDSDDAAPVPGPDEAEARTTESGGGDGDEAAGQVQAGGTLRYAYSISVTRWDPHRSTIGQDIRLLAPVYDRLVHYSPSGEFIPGLATDWQFSDDGMQLEVTLREGVTFHDGEPFNAEAVKANIERGQTVEGSSVSGDLEDITSVEVVDEHTVIFHLAEPNSILPGLLSARSGAMVSPAAFDNPDLDFAPVGAGPYRVTEYRVDDIIVMERFAEHWDTEAGGPDRIEIRILADDTTRMNALQSGDVDIALLRGTQIPDAEAAGLNVDARPALTYQVLYLNRAKSEFADPLVRQALNHAIDRDAFVDVVLGGAGEPAVQPFPASYFAYNEDYPGDHYPYDPERARELLAEAGLPDGFTFEMLVPSLETYLTGSQVVQSMMADIGVTVDLRQIEAAQTADIFYAQQDGESLLAQWGGRPDPQVTMNLQFSETGFSNPGRHTTPRFSELNDAAKAAIDPDERVDRLHEMVGEIVEQAFQVPIAHDYLVHAYTDDVKSLDVLAGGELYYIQMGVNG